MSPLPELEDAVLVRAGQGDADAVTAWMRGRNVDGSSDLENVEAAFLKECELRGIRLHDHVHYLPAQSVTGLHYRRLNQSASDTGSTIRRKHSDEFQHWCSVVQPPCMVTKALTGQTSDVLHVSEDKDSAYRLLVIESEDKFAFRVLDHLGQTRNGIGSAFVRDRPLKQGCRDLIVGLSVPDSELHTHIASLADSFTAALTAHYSHYSRKDQF